MHYLDEGQKFELLLKMLKVSERDLAKRLGVSNHYVSDRIRVWKYINGVHQGHNKIKSSMYHGDKELAEKISKAIGIKVEYNTRKVLNFKKAREIAVMEIPEKAKEYLVNKIIDEGLSFTELKKVISDS